MTTKIDKLGAAPALGAIIGANRTGQGGPQPAPAAAPSPTEGFIKVNSFADVPIDRVERDLNQPREEFDEDELRRLADSIIDRGQLTPIKVRPNGSGGWVVLVGERRWRACKMAGRKSIRVEVVQKIPSPGDLLAEQIIENVVRAAFKPAEEGRAYKRLMELNGWGPKELASGISVSESSVYRALELVKLPEDVAARVDAGDITPAVAREVAKLESPEEQRAVAAAAVAHDLDAKTVADVVHKAKVEKRAEGRGGANPKTPGKPKSSPKPPTFESFKVGSARVTVEFKKPVPDREVLDALQGAADRMRAKVEGAEALEAATRPMLALGSPDSVEDAA